MSQIDHNDDHATGHQERPTSLHNSDENGSSNTLVREQGERDMERADTRTVNQDGLDGQLNEKTLEKAFPEADPYLVVFDVDDPENPKNWGRTKRWFLTVAASMFVLNSTFASSAPSGIIIPVIEHFHFSQEVGILMVSLFVAGYCVGPLVWGPLSEQYGRKPTLIIAFFCYTGFQVGDALAPNGPALLIFRILGGLFAACPLTNSGAIIADIWDADTRGKAMALFCLAPFAGPALGPAVAGYIFVSGASWRWLFWTLTMFAGGCFLVIIFLIPETYTPVILVRKAERMRKSTGDQRYYAALEKHSLPLMHRVRQILAKPFVLLFSEPMLVAMDIYMGFVYGCMYLLFEAYPIVFEQGHHMNAGASGLMFIPLMIGAVGSIAIHILVFERQYEQKIQEFKPNPVPPEERLRVALWAAPIFAISFFWFGWTSYPQISYWAPMLAGLPLGASINLIFLGLLNYIVDAYLAVSASALASATVLRSFAGAGFPLFAGQMYTKLDPRWASTLLGCIAWLLVPIPFVLMRYGATLRQRSKNAPNK